MTSYVDFCWWLLYGVRSYWQIKTEKPMKSETTGHELGKTYLNKYWGEQYTVIAIHENGDITVRWHRDNRETTHCTPVENDPIIKWGNTMRKPYPNKRQLKKARQRGKDGLPNNYHNKRMREEHEKYRADNEVWLTRAYYSKRCSGSVSDNRGK